MVFKNTATSRVEIHDPFGSTPLSMDGLRGSNSSHVVRILPDVNVVKIGGQSVMDRGRAAVYPILEELIAASAEHRILICVGGGTRARHVYDIALGLGLPTGVLAALGEATPRQNARMLQMLMAPHGGVYIHHDDFDKLPLYFAAGCIPIMSGMPPFEYWEKPPAVGRIPANRTDSGTFLTAEFLGARSLIYIKDEDGLYTADPKKDSTAQFIPEITVRALLEMDLDDLVVERAVLAYMESAQHVRQIQVVNGLKERNITRALAGERVGSVIYAG